MTLPLAGIRVIELARVMAGPVCGLLLSDLGADVVKVEPLPDGDATRGFVPPDIGGESAAFMMLARGKRGVAVDFRHERGPGVIRRLVEEADVVLENFRAGTMERMGLGWDALRDANPRLVYGQVTGFGRTGPMAEQGGFDLIAQGWSGLMSVTGTPGGPPTKVGAPVTDVTAGILCALGVVSALYERETTGVGRRVDTSLFEAGITHTFWQSAVALATGDSPGPLGTAHPLTAPYQAFETADGWLNVGASNEATWRRLTGAVGLPELRDDPRFATNADRMEHREELADILRTTFRNEVTTTWLERLAAARVPAGPVATVGEMLAHPQTRARQMVVESEHPVAGRVAGLGMPVKLSGAGGGGRGADPADPGAGPAAADAAARPRVPAAPLLGEHTREVLAEAGYGEAEIDALVDAGVVAENPPG